MPPFQLGTLQRVLGSEPLIAEEDRTYTRFVFDSRAVKNPGTLFFALPGDHQDGHAYVPMLADKPGVCAVVKTAYQLPRLESIPLIRVEDPLKSAQNLALHARQDMKKTRFIGVTGSAGKTSAKEFIYQILNHRETAYRSPGNWNNWLGMPFALLNMTGDESDAVFELGMSQPGIGEIAFLTHILRPQVAVLLNALPVHLEFLKSVDRVAEAKCEILAGLGPDGIALYNVDSLEISKQLKKWPGKRLVSFSPSRAAGDLHFLSKKTFREGSELVCSFMGKPYTFFTPLNHPAQQVNILVAIGVALILGLDADVIAQRVAELTACDGRGVVRNQAGLTILDETYNSNPEAARMALDWLHDFEGSRVAVLGDMLELGEQSDAFHRQLGRYAATRGLKRLIAVGERARLIAEGAREGAMSPEAVTHVKTVAECRAVLSETLKAGDTVLFKASRGMALEKAIPL
jgi:UDP-N-acetylmuramoyl-tripeptide--D-alanyl-D-alanine ligase